MSEIVITVNNLSKRYRIGAKERGYTTIREAIVKGITAPVKNLVKLRDLTRFNNGTRSENDVIWALKNISFEVKHGEILGIIGCNGAGKSTLLKILSRVTEPTSGFVEMHGRVSSLLEVGTGFHPELTGRENIFLNGAILGMKKREIEDRFDDIVGFAEINKFLDTPVKRYSSGMHLRLAFAVAAHLDPQILILDEILAVGDSAFQKKCLGKMGDVAKDGRTVIFVSHNMNAVKTLCQRAICIREGIIVDQGQTADVIAAYTKSQNKNQTNIGSIFERGIAEVKNKTFYITRVEMKNENGEPASMLKYGAKIRLVIDLNGSLPLERYGLSFYLYNEFQNLVAVGSSKAYHDVDFGLDVKKVEVEIGPLTVTSGKYSLGLLCYHGEGPGLIRLDYWENAANFVIESQPFKVGRNLVAEADGICVLQHRFSANKK